MKKFILALMAVFAFKAMAIYPYKNNSEIRFVASHSGKLSFESLKRVGAWDISGQLLQKKISDQSQVGASFELGQGAIKESKLGANYVYSLNELLDVGISGDISNLKNLGGSFWLNLNYHYKGFLFKPFVNVDHRKLAETGLVTYFKIQGVECSFGVAFAPAVGSRKVSKLSLLFGTSFSENAIFDKFMGDKKGA